MPPAASDPSPLPPPRKTAAGGEALASRDPRFNAVQRRLLILIDGRRDRLILQGLLPAADVGRELDALAAAGLIETGASLPAEVASEVPAATAPAEPEPILPALPENWPEVCRWMSTHARDTLGVLASPLIDRIEKVEDAHGMLGAISQWHMALRGSRLGHASADEGLAQLRRMLAQ